MVVKNLRNLVDVVGRPYKVKSDMKGAHWNPWQYSVLSGVCLVYARRLVNCSKNSLVVRRTPADYG